MRWHRGGGLYKNCGREGSVFVWRGNVHFLYIYSYGCKAILCLQGSCEWDGSFVFIGILGEIKICFYKS